jgi:micrococcal nuclease
MYEYRAEYLSNYDGDTVKFMVDLGFNTFMKITVRLSGIDTPELRDPDPVMKAKAYEVKDFVRESLMGAKEIIIETEKDKTGKYGRYLATIYYDGTNLNKQLMDEGMAGAYG